MAWLTHAIKTLQAEQQRSADTHLIKIELPQRGNIDLYLKDESTHPTGSLKHRLARSLFLYALCNGKITQNTTIIEASSGSTAVSEAYFSRLLGLQFIAVMPRSTAQKKVAEIEQYGGQCYLVECPTQMRETAQALAKQTGGYFMDQFTYAERATDWRGNNNIAESIFRQMQSEPHPSPYAVVMGAGTGGTSATLGRYIKYKGLTTKLVVVDPEYSAFYPSYHQQSDFVTRASRIEGIGRPQVEPSFQADVIDQMVQVPDAASVAAMYWLQNLTGRKAGPSTGTNLWGILKIAQEMVEKGISGSLVSVLCDSGERYLDTYYDQQWVLKQIGEYEDYAQQIDAFFLAH